MQLRIFCLPVSCLKFNIINFVIKDTYFLKFTQCYNGLVDYFVQEMNTKPNKICKLERGAFRKYVCFMHYRVMVLLSSSLFK